MRVWCSHTLLLWVQEPLHPTGYEAQRTGRTADRQVESSLVKEKLHYRSVPLFFNSFLLDIFFSLQVAALGHLTRGCQVSPQASF